MSILTVRNISPETHRLLKQRAAAHGRSMEAEARAILDESVAPVEEPYDLIEGLIEIGRKIQLTDEELALLTPEREQPRDFNFGA